MKLTNNSCRSALMMGASAFSRTNGATFCLRIFEAMASLVQSPPFTQVEPVTEVLHGFPVTDPFRWLEDQDSPRTRKWLEEQTGYARGYLDRIPGRERIRHRIREFLAVETYDSLQKVGDRYFFCKRLPEQEQPCIYMRDGARGEDQLLLDPADRNTGTHTALKPLIVSPDGRLLLYEVKEGGERTGTFELFDINTRKILPDVLSRGHLYGFAFSPDSQGFYYVHEALNAERRFYRAAYYHILGRGFAEDAEIFSAGENEKLYLSLISDAERLGFVVYKFLETTVIDFYLKPFSSELPPETVITGADFRFSPLLIPRKVLALTDRDAPNLRIVQLDDNNRKEAEWIDIVAESDSKIDDCRIAGDRIFVSYIRPAGAQVCIFDFSGHRTGEIPIREHETVRFVGGIPDSDELFLEQESFTEPISIFRYSPSTGKQMMWSRRSVPFETANYGHVQVWYTSKDGTRVPMFLMGRHDVLAGGPTPAIMTSYGGFGLSMTPQFSSFVAFLVERGCLFALPNIRGGSEFGGQWHNAAKRRNRQNAHDDFLSAAAWLIETKHTTADRLAIFGGSNSGLLVGAALTQRPDLFRAVVCMVPLLDMIRYHLFDCAKYWQDEFGTAEDPDDFAALLNYSPYHQVREGVVYPATLIVSGDADKQCNSLHARKMTARLQAANTSEHPIVLAYSEFRGHSPVLPLSERIEALTDRMAFLCDQLRLPV
jgi:prolyl oligopeptidase